MNEFTNLAEKMKEDELRELGVKVVEGYELDDSTREGWKEKHAEWIKLYAMERPPKNEPFENCSNVGLPVLTTAAIQFHAGAYPSLLPAKGLVKANPVVMGADARDIADRKAKYLEHYLRHKSERFRSSMDDTIMKLPVEGTVIRKKYYCPIKKVVVSDWVSPMNFVIHYGTRDLMDCERYTHVLFETETRIKQKIDLGFYVKGGEYGPGDPSNVVREEYDRQSAENTGHEPSSQQDDTTPRMVLEQYVFLDLSKKKNQIKKQYIVTVDFETSEVLRIVENVSPKTGKPIHVFNKYGFIKNPNGFYDFGFGLLLEGSNKAMNSIINQLIDSGSLQNVSTGFFDSGSSMKQKDIELQMGKLIGIKMNGDDIRKEIMPFKFSSPSQVLYALLGTLQQYTDKMTTVTELRTGALPKSDTSATAVTALIQEGQRVFNMIHMRSHEELSKEIAAIHDLVALHLDIQDYYRVVIDPVVDMVDPVTKQQNISENDMLEMLKADWEEPYLGVALLSDPSVTNTQEKVAKAEFLLNSVLQSPVTQQNENAIRVAQENLYKAMDIDSDIVVQVMEAQQVAPPDLPQEEENQIFLKDGMVEVLESQDHDEHLRVMEEFENSEFFNYLTPIGKRNFENHRRQHIGFVYKFAVSQQQQQQQQQMEGGNQQVL